MALRKRLALVFAAVLTALSALYGAIFVEVVRPGFVRMEQAEAERDLRRIREAVQRAAEEVNLLAGDWADWDDTYAFIQDGNQEYRNSNLVPTLFSQIRIQLLILLDRQGRAVWHGIVDPDGGGPLDLPEFPPQGLPQGHPLLRIAGHSDPLFGVVRTARGPMLLSARPIRYSDRSGTSAGTLLMGRLLDDASEMSRLVQLDLSITSPETLAEAQPALAAGLADGRASALVSDGKSLLGAVQIADLSGVPAMVVHARLPHDLSDAARRTVQWSLGAAALGGMVLLTGVLWLADRVVLRPLRRLSRHVAALGETGDLSSRLKLQQDDEVGVLADSFDRLTDRLEAAAAERDRAQAQLLDGIHRIADGFALWDADDRLVLCNGLYTDFFPRVTDLVRPGAAFADIAAAAAARGQLDLPAAESESWVARRVAEHRNPGAPVEYRLGDGRWLEIREQRTREGGVVGIYIDITGRKQGEERLRSMLGELERSNTDLEQFAYIASHDLQEPLRQVASYVQLLERRYASQLDDDAREFIRYAVDGAKRMQDQINDLLAYARLNRQERPFAPVDCGEALGVALGNLRAAVAAAGARVEAEALPTVLGDRVLIIQLLQNLISNAIKYAKADVAPIVRVDAAREGAFWRLSISDNGIGIDERYADRIFRIFQRLHSRDQYDGTGIGLAICKRIVERHGGEISVQSAAGKGSTFHIILPAVPEHAAVPATEMAP